MLESQVEMFQNVLPEQSRYDAVNLLRYLYVAGLVGLK